MNNLKYYEDSLAYDFSLFSTAEQTQPQKRGKVIDIPEEQKKRAMRRKAAAAKNSGRVTAVLVTVFIIALLGGNIMLRSRISETEQKIAQINDQISEADSKLAAATFEMEQKISYTNLESAARALGMRKMDKTQIVYIRTNQEDKAVVGDEVLSAENN